MEKHLESNMMAIDKVDAHEELTRNVEPNQTINSSYQVKRRKIKVLIVDDNRAILRVLSQILSYMGFEVIEADSTYEARDIFLNTTFDLVITDLEMPEMDGSMLASLIKKESPQTPVILVTASEEEAAMKKIRKSCIDTVLFKPFRINELEEKIQTTLRLNS